MKLSPCIDTIYKGRPLKEALTEIKDCGYSGFEFWSPDSWDLEEMVDLKTELGLEIANFNNPVIDITSAREKARFLTELEKTMRIGERIGCRRITVLSGNDTGEDRLTQRKALVDALKTAADMLEKEDFHVVLEASNRRVNRPNNYLVYADEAFSIIDEIDSPNVRMLYDIYHQQISEGDLLVRLIPNIDKIGHFHSAGVPNRHELHLCEINYDFIFDEIKKTSYSNWVGLEYFPILPPRVGLELEAKHLG